VKKAKPVKTSWAALSLTDLPPTHPDASRPDGTPGRPGVVVCLKTDGAPRCLRFEPFEQLAEALARKALVVHKWAVAAPRALYILKAISLPAADPDEAARMAEFEVPSLVPLSAQEVIYGCTVAGRQDHLLRVLVYLIKAEALARYLEPCRAAGIEPQRVVPDVLAMHAWFLRAVPDVAAPAVFVLAESTQCHILTSHEGNFQDSQVRPLGDDRAADAQEIAHEVLDRGAHLAARAREGREASESVPAAVVLAGGSPLVPLLAARLRAAAGMDTATITVIDVPTTSALLSDQGGTEGQDGAAVTAAGLLELSAGAQQPHVNLLPPEHFVQEQRRMVVRNGLRVAALAALVVVLTWVCLGAANRRLTRACGMIKAQIAPIEKLAGGVDRKRQRLKAVQRQLANRGRITETLAELYECTPKEISLSVLDVAWKQGAMSIDLQGRADLLPTAFEYTNAVRDAPLLRTMQILDAQQVPRADGRSVVEFKAHCSIPDALPGGPAEPSDRPGGARRAGDEEEDAAEVRP
jgi:type II secretory pathway component PulL